RSRETFQKIKAHHEGQQVAQGQDREPSPQKACFVPLRVLCVFVVEALSIQTISRPPRTRRPAVAIFPRPCPPCAWAMAQARASAASAEGSPGRDNKRTIMACTCSLAALPCPTTACLTCSAVYSETGRSASTSALIAAPRA